MAEAAFDAIGAVVARWTMGSPAAPIAPPEWVPALGDEPGEAELRLLALSSQLLALVVAEPGGALRSLPDLPALGLPTLPDALRPLARRIARSAPTAGRRHQLLHFLAARGWVMHPGDWLPGAGEEGAPDAYAPWRDWAEAASAGKTVGDPGDVLTDANWEDFWPAARGVAFAALRARDPAAARQLLEARFAVTGAEERLRLLDRLATKLSEADADFLAATAAGDRAPRVKALAAALLARLGRSSGGGEDAAELGGYFAVGSKGLLRRTRIIEFRNDKTAAQKQRRTTLLDTVDLAAFAGALDIDVETLLDAWQWGDQPLADLPFAAMIARSGSDAQVARAAERAIAHERGAGEALPLLAARLSPAQRTGFAAATLRAGTIRFAEAAELARGGAGIDDPLATPAGKALLATLARDEARPADAADDLAILGLIATQAGARAAIDRLTGGGMLLADPRLDTLRLNAALDQGRSDR